MPTSSWNRPDGSRAGGLDTCCPLSASGSATRQTIALPGDDRRQTLTIGERQGSFPGMIANRTFRVVHVRAGHGVGASATDSPDRVVPYCGTALTVARE